MSSKESVISVPVNASKTYKLAPSCVDKIKYDALNKEGKSHSQMKKDVKNITGNVGQVRKLNQKCQQIENVDIVSYVCDKHICT